MELKVSEYVLPAEITSNYEELKQELAEKIHHYETLVYTDDQIKDAKDDRANLNKLKKALNDERIRREKEYMIPFNTFKAQVQEVISMIDKPIGLIDERIKDFEAHQKLEKKEKIFAEFNAIRSEAPENAKFIAFSQIFEESWCNSSVSLKSIKEKITFIFTDVSRNIETLEQLPEFSFEAVEFYKKSLNMADAIAEAKKMSDMQKAKAQAEAMKVLHEAKEVEKPAATIVETAPFEEERKWISFSAHLTTTDAIALKNFFESRNIDFKPI